MSQYYAGYYGIGCVLSVEEFKNFLTSYFTKHPDLTEKEQEEVRIEEYAFKRSNENGIFHIVEISTDYADGMQLLRLNKEDDPAGYCVDLRGKDQYVVFSDYQPDTLEFIRHPKYHDYEDILKEFKGKLESYLPEKFPWDRQLQLCLLCIIFLIVITNSAKLSIK